MWTYTGPKLIHPQPPTPENSRRVAFQGHEDGNGAKLTVKKWWLFGCRFFTVCAEFFTVCKGRKRWKKHLVIDMSFFTVSFSRFTPLRSKGLFFPCGTTFPIFQAIFEVLSLQKEPMSLGKPLVLQNRGLPKAKTATLVSCFPKTPVFTYIHRIWARTAKISPLRWIKFL